MQRTIILIIAGIVITAGVVLAGITLWKTITKPGALLGPGVSPQPTPQESPVRTISQGNVISPAIDARGERVRFFDLKDHKLKEVDFSAKTVNTLSEQEFQNVFRVYWPSTSTLVILEYEDEFSNRKLSLVDIASGTTTALNSNIRQVAWSPDASQIAYHWRDDASGQNAIFIASPLEMSKRQNVMPLQLLAVNLFWLSPELLLIAQAPTPGLPTLVMTRNIKTNTTKIILEDRFGVSVRPSPDGKKILVSSTLDAAGSQVVAEVFDVSSSKLLATLPFATLAEKCAWSLDSETLFCAIPQELKDVQGWPFSYWTGTVLGRDAFISYNIRTETKRELSTTTLDIDAIDLALSKQESQLMFINRLDGRLTLFNF
jgi:hypothetical protein